MTIQLQNALKLSMLVTLSGSLLIIGCGVFLHMYLHSMVIDYIDLLVRDENTTKFLINSQESIVPNKDDLPEEIDLGNWPQLISLVVSGLGASLFFFSLFGFIVLTSRNSDYLLVLVILTMVGLVGQFLLFGSIIDLNSDFNFRTKERLVDKLHKQYEVGAKTNSSFTFLVNSFMLMGQCCGIDGPADFFRMGSLNYSYVLQDESYYAILLFPLACCNRTYIDSGFQATIECAKSKEIAYINNRGCYEETYAYVQNNYGTVVVSLFTFLILWEMIQILAGIAILFAPSKVEMDAINQVLEAAEYEDINQKSFRICDSALDQMKPLSRKPVTVPVAKVPSLEHDAGITSQIW